ncbi:hypothetical protein KDW63_12215 [Burkholderia cenocepacia]|uniref:hypothetical protein n=1 Tax=Burkholderia cenocepacia TaxID=95486 RepID=UPI001BA117CC|nr:hypothetical protein [Burkholderia cenocepacia]MBR8294948.1 hypothetical protein [Burkholderia cenocepacia]
MLSDDAYIRKLPAFLDPVQRVHLESLVFSVDAIAISISRIKHIANQYGTQIGSAKSTERTEMLIHAWTIVDCVHVIRQTLTALKLKKDSIVNYISKYDSARTLRNNMDHLTGNAKNVSNSKGRPPTYGCLGYIYISDEDLTFANGTIAPVAAHSICVMSGTVLDEHKLKIINPLEKELRIPSCLFELDAFGESISLEQAAEDSIGLISELSSSAEKELRDAAEKISIEHNVSKDELLAHHAAGLSICIRMEFSDLPNSADD